MNEFFSQLVQCMTSLMSEGWWNLSLLGEEQYCISCCQSALHRQDCTESEYYLQYHRPDRAGRRQGIRDHHGYTV
jgi:hypothetical protein